MIYKIRMTQEDVTKLEELARQKDVPVSKYIDTIVFEALEKLETLRNSQSGLSFYYPTEQVDHEIDMELSESTTAKLEVMVDQMLVSASTLLQIVLGMEIQRPGIFEEILRGTFDA